MKKFVYLISMVKYHTVTTREVVYDVRNFLQNCWAGVAELADAHDSGSCG